jgi:ethanolaminephosphotransferase
MAVRSLERKARDGMAALLGITPFGALMGLSALWVMSSPSDIFTDHPRLIMWIVGLHFAKVGRPLVGQVTQSQAHSDACLSPQMVMHMMLSHMCEEPFWLLRKTFSVQLAVSFLLVVGIVPLVRPTASRPPHAYRE